MSVTDKDKFIVWLKQSLLHSLSNISDLWLDNIVEYCWTNVNYSPVFIFIDKMLLTRKSRLLQRFNGTRAWTIVRSKGVNRLLSTSVQQEFTTEQI